MYYIYMNPSIGDYFIDNLANLLNAENIPKLIELFSERDNENPVYSLLKDNCKDQADSLRETILKNRDNINAIIENSPNSILFDLFTIMLSMNQIKVHVYIKDKIEYIRLFKLLGNKKISSITGLIYYNKDKKNLFTEVFSTKFNAFYVKDASDLTGIINTEDDTDVFPSGYQIYIAETKYNRATIEQTPVGKALCSLNNIHFMNMVKKKKGEEDSNE